jgi:hypothetical protein
VLRNDSFTHDQDLVTVFVFDRRRFAQANARHLMGSISAASFNEQSGIEKKSVERLSDEALLVLDLSMQGRIRLYRSLSETILLLVRAGTGTVSSSGYFLPDEESACTAADLCKSLGLRMRWDTKDGWRPRTDHLLWVSE